MGFAWSNVRASRATRFHHTIMSITDTSGRPSPLLVWMGLEGLEPPTTPLWRRVVVRFQTRGARRVRRVTGEYSVCIIVCFFPPSSGRYYGVQATPNVDGGSRTHATLLRSSDLRWISASRVVDCARQHAQRPYPYITTWTGQSHARADGLYTYSFPTAVGSLGT